MEKHIVADSFVDASAFACEDSTVTRESSVAVNVVATAGTFALNAVEIVAVVVEAANITAEMVLAVG